MKAIEIITNLISYRKLLDELYKKEIQISDLLVISKSIKVEYNFITVELKKKIEGPIGTREESLVCLTFENKRNLLLLSKMYVADESLSDWLESRIIEDVTLHNKQWKTSFEQTVKFNGEVENYLAIADRIAEAGHNCSAGDNYSPGYYSEIAISGKSIILSQINYLNSRSIDHKDNYHLRELKIRIPLDGQKAEQGKLKVNEIGAMQIYFSDRSSVNNKECGQRIQSRIEEEKEKYYKK